MRWVTVVSFAALSTALAACEEPVPNARPAGSADPAKSASLDSPAAGGKMKDVAKTLEGKGLSAEELAKQPPPDGIFPPGVADKAHALDAPPKLEMINAGDEPRIQLHAATPEAQLIGVNLQLAIQGRQATRFVFVDISPPEQAGKQLEKFAGELKKELEKAESQAKKEDEGKGGAKPKPTPAASASASASASAAPAAPEPPAAMPTLAPGADRPLVATMMDFSPNGEMGANLNATLQFTLTKAGAMSFKRSSKITHADPQETASDDFVIGAIEELLIGLYTGVPDKPVGANAMWTVADRRTSFGSDVVRYRLFQVEKVEGDEAALGVIFRQYAASDTNALLKDPEIVFGAYMFEGGGKIQVSPKALLPKNGMLQVGMKAQRIPKDKKGDPSVPGEPFEVEAMVRVIDTSSLSFGPAPEGDPKQAPPGKGPKKGGAEAPPKK
ncbi:MAG: hypothetical protein IPG04_18675 [Polyangiaceae bacterium]|nr:hypothetical protein [Polyangiaceae bacterium]